MQGKKKKKGRSVKPRNKRRKGEGSNTDGFYEGP